MTIEAMQTAVRDGVSIRYTDTGSGDPPLVFVHGWTCNHTNWRAQVAHFRANHRVLALDQRGHGASDKPDQDYGIPGFVDDLGCFIHETGADRPVVVGHSMGGVIALNLAHRYPELLRAIVMIDSPIVPLPEALAPMLTGFVQALKSPEYQGTAEGFARTQFFNSDTAPALIEELLPAMMSAPQRLMHTAIASTVDAVNQPAGEIPVPALLIRAATAFASEEDFRSRYPELQVHTINCAHFVQMEKPAETNALIDAFLESLA
jgi:pimeloyl-ACP methyl ester carboxylesterase